MSKARARFVAPLRRIKVRGCRIIRMADLRRVFEMAGCTMVGCTDVATYVQSGTVVFCSRQTKTPGLTARIEKALSEAFRYASRVVVLSAGELGRVVAQPPRGFGKDVDRYRYDVLLVKHPLTAREILEQVAGVAAAPGAFCVRVWHLMSRRRESTGRTPPEGLEVRYPMTKMLRVLPGDAAYHGSQNRYFRHGFHQPYLGGRIPPARNAAERQIFELPQGQRMKSTAGAHKFVPGRKISH